MWLTIFLALLIYSLGIVTFAAALGVFLRMFFQRSLREKMRRKHK